MQFVDVLELWDYSNPAESEARFREILKDRAAAGDTPLCGLIQTQLARTFSLRGQFERAHALLGESDLSAETSVGGVYWHLEKGRTWNSSGEREVARKHFEIAMARAVELDLDAEAVDAAHMIAITMGASDEGLAWTERALNLSGKSRCPRARKWRASLSNNLGWTRAARGDFKGALESFQVALAARKEQGGARQIQIARYAVGHAMRKLGLLDEALELQQALLSEVEEAGQGDGYILEEVAECMHALGDERAAGYFARAHETLSQDAWLRENDTARLERLHTLSGAADA